MSYSNYCNRDPLCITESELMSISGWGGVWLVAVLVSSFFPYFGVGRGFSHVGKSSVVALVFGFGMDSCQISVILNHCTKRDFFGLYKFQCSCGW